MFTAQSVTAYWHSSLWHQGYGVDNFMHIQECEWMSVLIVCCDVCIYEMKQKKPCERLTRPMIFCLLSFTLQSEPYLCLHTQKIMFHIMDINQGFLKYILLAVTVKVNSTFRKTRDSTSPNPPQLGYHVNAHFRFIEKWLTKGKNRARLQYAAFFPQNMSFLPHCTHCSI